MWAHLIDWKLEESFIMPAEQLAQYPKLAGCVSNFYVTEREAIEADQHLHYRYCYLEDKDNGE